MIHTHTMTQLKTVQNPLKLASSNSTNLSVLASSTYSNNIPLSTTAAPTASAGGVFIPASSLNYVKIVPVFKTNVTAPKFKVTGWNKCVNESNTLVGWVPQCLFEGSVTLGTNAITVNSATDFRVALTIAKNFGDAKVYNSTSILDTSFILVDTLGCELIELEFVTSGSLTANAANAFIGAL